MTLDPDQDPAVSLPNPKPITVGQLARLLDDQAKSWELIQKSPTQSVPDEYVRRDQRLRENPAYRQFVEWANIKLGRNADYEAAQELCSRLAKRLDKPFAVIDLIPLPDAMYLVDRSEAPSPPAEDPARPPPDAPMKEPSVSELRDKGFERITVERMHEDWHIGVDEIELMADRAVRDDWIYDDYEILNRDNPKKQTQLWARLKPHN